MALTSSKAAGTRRRVAGKKGVVAGKEGLPGTSRAVGAAELEDSSYRASRSYTPEAPGAAALPNDPAAAAAGPSPHATAAAAGAAVPIRLQRWLGRARALGLREPEDLVFELHVRQGLPLLVVAQALDLSLTAVRALWEVGRATRAAKAPKSEAEMAALREHLSAVLWQTVEATFPTVPLLGAAGEDLDEEEPGPTSPPMLSVRLKALDQIAKLYDVGGAQSAAAGGGPLPYATPEEIADEVRRRVLEMHGRNDETRMRNEE